MVWNQPPHGDFCLPCISEFFPWCLHTLFFDPQWRHRQPRRCSLQISCHQTNCSQIIRMFEDVLKVCTQKQLFQVASNPASTPWILRKVVNLGSTVSVHLSFSQKYSIGNNANIGIRGFTRRKQEKISNKMLPLVRIDTGLWLTSDSEHRITGLTSILNFTNEVDH